MAERTTIILSNRILNRPGQLAKSKTTDFSYLLTRSPKPRLPPETLVEYCLGPGEYTDVPAAELTSLACGIDAQAAPKSALVV